MSRPVELLTTIGAGALGAVLAVTVIGASLMLALPGVVAVALIAWVATASRTR